MRAATGQWIALLDSDDQWLPDKTRIQMDILSRYPQIDLLGSNVNHEQTRILWRLKDRLSPVKPWELFIKWHPSTPTVVFRRSVIEAIGYYNEAMRHGEDGEFLLRICMRKSCWFTPEHLVFCGEGKPTFGDSGLSADLLAMQRGQRQILKYARKERAIGPIQYVFFRLYAELKHWRRVIIVYNRNRKKR